MADFDRKHVGGQNDMQPPPNIIPELDRLLG
jgi:hypothetical protein